MADREKIIKNIKNGGSLVIYVGTASLMKPLIFRDNQERNAVNKFAATASGTVISLGIANYASKFFGKLVDEVDRFIDDIRPAKKNEGDAKHA